MDQLHEAGSFDTDQRRRWIEVVQEADDLMYTEEGLTVRDVEELGPTHRRAVVLYNLEGQTDGGGGFSFWIDNGYSDEADLVSEALEAIGTETCRIVADLVRGVQSAIASDGSRNEGVLFRASERLNELRDQFVQEVESYFRDEQESPRL